jgi:hypothetical protein
VATAWNVPVAVKDRSGVVAARGKKEGALMGIGVEL